MDLLTWHKTNPIPACNHTYLSDTEYLLFFREKGVPVYGNYDTKRKWYASPLNVDDKKFYHHPTIKPLEITKNLIFNSASKDNGNIPIVLDPFMGSGTTAVAAKQLGFDYVGFEIDPQYYNYAVKRVAGAISKSIESWGIA